ncbi:YceD family protein [Cesiribacter andamanensis]|uniref:Putative ACR n=1 Tax=Cesiribacter andamanensis AMV16 TaxID=1279009 RepID=M7NWA2_9BACT|nr:YceD family protein [Cesiribacter andamanensis]EMR02724.1 putative ACR [Cesiribacter andamanensis AMV16]
MRSKKTLELYDIDVFRLSNGEHLYEMPINDEFFSLFEWGLIEKGSGTANILLRKSETMMTVDADVNGEVELVCDRSLETFSHPVSLHEVLYIKYGETEEALEDDLLVITRNTQKINLAQFLYEIIGASLPMKKIHPDHRRDDDDDPEDDGEGTLVYSSDADPSAADEEEESGDAATDPRWDILKNLRDN